MYTFIAIVFMLALGALIAAQGWIAILWLPLGLAFSLFASSNILLLPIMGIPLARRLKKMGMARPGLERAILGVFAILCIVILAFFGVLAWFFPSLFPAAMHNPSLLVGVGLGAVGVLLTPLSANGKKDFELDFFKRFSKYIEVPGLGS